MHGEIDFHIFIAIAIAISINLSYDDELHAHIIYQWNTAESKGSQDYWYGVNGKA